MQSAVLCSINIAQFLAGVLCLLLAHLTGCGKARTGNANGVHNSKPTSNSTTPHVPGSSTQLQTSTSVPESKTSDKNKSTSHTNTPKQAKSKSSVAPSSKPKDPKTKTANEDNEIDDSADMRPSQREQQPFNRKKAKGAFWHFFLKRDNDRRRRTKRKRQEQQNNLKASDDLKTAAEAEDDQKITYDNTQQDGGTCATAKGNTNMTTNTQQATCSTFKSTPSAHVHTAQKVE